MSDYIIISDSTADLPDNMVRELGVEIVPFNFSIDGKNYLNYPDYRQLSSKEFYSKLREGKSAATSLVTSYVYMETFGKYLKQGMDILYLCFSSGLSGSYGQALLAAEELSQSYPGNRIIILDTLCASMGQGLLTYYAAMEKEKGSTIEQNAEFVKKMIPNLCHWFMVDDLAHLKRGGRISGIEAAMGTMLGIRPILHVDDNGKLAAVDKVRGRKKALAYLADKMQETVQEPKDQLVCICHADAEEDAEALEQMVKERIDAKAFVISDIGPVIGAHTGPGAMLLFFLGSQR